jgi:broad specificity phosphatase PhoE
MLLIARHAESIENAAKYNGFYQDPRPYSGAFAQHLCREIVGLTPRGFRQASWLGAVLASLASQQPVLGYCSTYRRTIDTSAIALPGLPEGWPVQTALLDEQNYGDATYMTKRELYAAYPETAEERRTRKHQWTAPGGECLSVHVLGRAREFINSISGDIAAGADIVAITHQTTIIALRSHLEGSPIPDLLAREKQGKTPNAAIFAYEFRDSRFDLRDVINPPM